MAKRKKKKTPVNKTSKQTPKATPKPSQTSAKTRRERQRQAQQKALRQRQFTIISIVSVLLLSFVAFAVYRNSTVAKVENTAEEVDPNNRIGSVNAPIEIVEFADFGCPACRQYHNLGIKDQLFAEFGEQISFTFRHFPVITQWSPKAAEAGQCASEQGQFWEYHDYIYERTPQNAIQVNQLKDYAALLGLDSAQFNTCLDSGQYANYVARDLQAAQLGGARGTPTFFVNGEQVTPDFDSMAGAIRQILEEQG